MQHIFPKTSGLEYHHQMVWFHIQDTHRGVLPLCREYAVCVFYSPNQQSKGRVVEGEQAMEGEEEIGKKQ